MAKKSNAKNIILTNLPAAAALLLMAAALKLTLQYSFFISLIVLVVVYFLLGVTIELVLEKAEAKKKRENLFKQFSEGGRSNLPTGRNELYGDTEYEEPVFPEQDQLDDIGDLDMVRKPLDEVNDGIDFLADPEGKFTDDFEESEAYVEEEAVSDYQEEISTVAVESLYGEESVTEPELQEEKDDFLNVTINDLVHEEEAREESESESDEDIDSFFAGAFGDGAVSETNDEEEISEVREEEIVAEEFTLEDIPTEDNNFVDEPESIASETEADVISTEEVVQEEAEIEAKPDAEAETEELPQENPEVNEELYDALKEVGAIPEEPVDETPAEEKEARRSLFDGNDFDAENTAGRKQSLIFGSVPDTEDDLEYIPPVVDNSATPKKGKVQVDSKKIDELYAFKKANAGESFFGRRKKNNQE